MAAPSARTTDLRRQAEAAKALRAQLDEVIYQADKRLCSPQLGMVGVPRAENADWTWRPKLWRGPLHSVGLVAVENRTPLGSEATIFHDCDVSELSFRQVRNLRPDDLAPYGVRMDLFRFDGTFLSVAIDFPPAAMDGLRKRHLIRVNTVVEYEKPVDIYARLNIRSGPNTEQMNSKLPLDTEDVAVEFDLADTDINEHRVEALWLDLIFDGPEMNQVTVRDVNVSRAPRADI